MEAVVSPAQNQRRPPRADPAGRRYGDTMKGTAEIVLALILLCGHSCILVYGVWVVQDTMLSLILAVGIIAIAFMLIVRAFRVETARDRWYHPLLTYIVAVAIPCMWLILDGIYIGKDQKNLRLSESFQSALEEVGLTNWTSPKVIETVAYVSIQLITPIIVLTAWFIPRQIDNKTLSKLLFSCLAIAFDIVELQDNIHEPKLRCNETLAYLVLLFSSLSLIQMVQLSQLFASRVAESLRWEAFWTIYGVVCQEIPFLSIRIYIMTLEGMALTEIIFPLKNAFGILFGVYHAYALLKTKKKQAEEKRNSMPGAQVVERGERSILWSKRRRAFKMTFPLLFLFAHLGLLTWRVVCVCDNNPLYWLLSLIVLPFIAITVPRAYQHRRQIHYRKTKASIWYQPILLYLLGAIACFWLIMLTQIDSGTFFDTKTVENNTDEFSCKSSNSSVRYASSIIRSSYDVIPTTSQVPVRSTSLIQTSPPVSEPSNIRSSPSWSLTGRATVIAITFPVPPVATEIISPTPSTPLPVFNLSSGSPQGSSVLLPSRSPAPTPQSAGRKRRSEDEKEDKKNDTSFDYRVNDETSYVLVQLVLPMAILIRWWMPREGLSHEDFSSLLQFALATAFDLAEFSHLLVDLPELHNHRTLVILVMLFSSTSLLLLTQLDVGLGSQSPRDEAIWMAFTILFLDGPFFVVRVYILTRLDTEVEQFQLVFLLKNIFAVLFGIYRIIALRSRGKDKEKDEYPGTEPLGEIFANKVAEETELKNGQKNTSFSTHSPSLQPGDSLTDQSVVISNEAVMSPTTPSQGQLSN